MLEGQTCSAGFTRYNWQEQSVEAEVFFAWKPSSAEKKCLHKSPSSFFGTDSAFCMTKNLGTRLNEVDKKGNNDVARSPENSHDHRGTVHDRTVEEKQQGKTCAIIFYFILIETYLKNVTVFRFDLNKKKNNGYLRLDQMAQTIFRYSIWSSYYVHSMTVCLSSVIVSVIFSLLRYLFGNLKIFPGWFFIRAGFFNLEYWAPSQNGKIE